MFGMSNEGTVDEIVEERAKVYGSYKKGVQVRATIVDAMKDKYEETHDEIDSEMLIMFSDLALKLMRFASEPTYRDSLDDLAGYCKIINRSLQGEDCVDN
jgi:hypothetical protein